MIEAKANNYYETKPYGLRFHGNLIASGLFGLGALFTSRRARE